MEKLMQAGKKKKLMVRRLLLWITSALVFLIAIVLLFSLVIKLILGVSSFEGFGLIRYSVSVKNPEYNENKSGSPEYLTDSKTVAATYVIKDSVAYFNFTDIADECGAKVSGDETRIRYIFSGGEVTFYYDGTLAYVGSEAVILDAPSYYEDGELFVPATFSRYMHGLSVSYKNRKLSVKFDPEEVRPSNIGKIDKPTQVTDD